MSLKTNENIDKIIESYLKNPPKEELNKVFSKNTKINKLYLNNSQNKVYIDVSKEFVQEMNAGSSLESMILQSLVNTLGNYYNVDKVYISVEGKPYESGHIAITENEVFYVDYKNVYEIK
ncbi:GerMN domain-containing protein [Thermobrachium celere]|uniref:GerMN domain-containing protein n=1 Tax=Thermobrachium celere TaxID=53422 RepID=UPI001FAF3732|nr:GerMN domain-containing protein [Thermobrachium celere]